MRIIRTTLLLSFLFMLVLGCSKPQTPEVKNFSKPHTLRPFSMNESVTPDLAGGKESHVRKPEPLTLAELRAKYSSTFLLHGPPAPKRIALTFDDVPDDYFTPLILDTLKQLHVKATFFVVGNRAESHPDIVRRMINEGHIIGNHSYSHANLPKIVDSAFRDEVLRTEDIIKKITGKTMLFIRPPYGNVSEDQIKWIASKHMKIINWNVDSLDWKGLSADQVKANIMSNISSGAIVLQHGAGGVGEDLTGTIEALPSMVAELRAQNIELVTIPELLHKPAYR
ncbi:polysaccharide deacetylase family protein [Paenibacillus guangzhouensis]|uniref:polysaccharide deacetylase family protein n=1 Tax=Paenibacillus guangzhouensis TaxID=1473112 RepID=UPI0012674810|nr:polysaccharide deacetylase family protein [Paenibacillus guangzhouensis]